MKKIIVALTLLSIGYADVPSAGRPNPSAFEHERVSRLDQIDNRLEDMQKELEKLQKKIEYLAWLLDGSIYDEHPPLYPH